MNNLRAIRTIKAEINVVLRRIDEQIPILKRSNDPTLDKAVEHLEDIHVLLMECRTLGKAAAVRERASRERAIRKGKENE